MKNLRLILLVKLWLLLKRLNSIVDKKSLYVRVAHVGDILL
uniref:Uncharacterized protein n=1 Tax=Heterorhabditis bacteriophora TaxID=37862 RepID=A0A1I7WLU8_HETBA